MNKKQPFALGADPSLFDQRTFKHDVDITTAIPLIEGGHTYFPEDIEHQRNVGICTAISLTQNANKALGKKFSPDFQYLLQKKFYDLNWYEGSSIFNALRVGKNYGFLPIELFPYVNENDRNLPYYQYIARLQAIPDSEVNRLIALCTDKLAGYASLHVDAQSLAQGILDSKAGILCRYNVGQEWWTPSWNAQDIDPIKPPQNIISGHAIGANYFDFTNKWLIQHPNTWGTLWDIQGKGHTINNEYAATEAWIPYYSEIPVPPTFKHNFQTDMMYGETNNEVKALQQALSILGYFKTSVSGFYGPITKEAVFAFQKDRVSLSWLARYVYKGHYVYGKTRDALNAVFNK